MRKLLPLFPLVVIVALAVAQEGPDEQPEAQPAQQPEAQPEPVEFTVKLEAARPSDEARLGYSKARTIALETSVPRFLFEVPDFRSKEPLFFRVTLGETKGVPYYGALDQSGATGHYDLLYLDKDRDLDLTNDGKPIEARIRTLFSSDQKLVEFLGISLDLPYNHSGAEVHEPYQCVFFFMAAGKKRPLTVQVERDAWREGIVALKDGKSYRVVLVDDDSDGQYTTSDTWTLREESVPRKQLLETDATRSMLFPSWSADQKWTIDVKSVDAAGRQMVLIGKPAKETEHDFFLRIAKQRQPPEEKALDIDPLRPKATDNQQVDWIEGRGAAYALQIAASPTVKKPVLLFFASNANPLSVQMDKYAFRDREVVALAKRFVCARIDATKMKGDMDKYRVDRIPILVFLTQDGVEISRTGAGFIKPRNLAADMKAALR